MHNFQIFFISAVAIVCVLAFFLIRNQILRRDTAEITKSVKGGDFIKWLTAYEVWYTISSRRLHDVLFLCRLTPIFIGFVVAIMATVEEASWPLKSYFIIGFTGLSTLCTAVLTQLRISEIAAVREAGRIGFARLVLRARLSFPEEAEAESVLKEKQAIVEEAFKIESVQADTFSLLVRPAPPSTSDGK
jgi:hypothetical protein